MGIKKKGFMEGQGEGVSGSLAFNAHNCTTKYLKQQLQFVATYSSFGQPQVHYENTLYIPYI